MKAKRGPRNKKERSDSKNKGTLFDYFVKTSSIEGSVEPLGRKRGASDMDLFVGVDMDPVEEIKRRRIGSQKLFDGSNPKLRGCQIC